MRRRSSICALAWVTACAGQDDRRTSGLTACDSCGQESGSGVGDGGPGEDGGPGAATTDGADDGDTATTDDPKFDLAAQPDGGYTGEPGCHKIDFVFIVDNSSSMVDDQANLVANFPAFIQGIEAALDDVSDVHVGVVVTTGYAANVAGCTALGGLVVQTGGPDSSASQCGPYAEGFNFMTQADDLGTAFGCAAQVGAGGWPIETPMAALEAVVGGDLAGAGQCNSGFLRGDALLVAVIITDEWDGPGDPELLGSPGTPQTWFDSVVAAKGLPGNAAIVSLTNYAGGPCPPSEPVFDGQHIVTFTELFGPNGFVGGVCEADYGPIFAQAIGVVDTACDGFVPPG